MLNVQGQGFDSHVVEGLVEGLFNEKPTKQGLDLVAINVQRAREHGIPGYGEFLKICGLPSTSFRFIRPRLRKYLREMYGDVSTDVIGNPVDRDAEYVAKFRLSIPFSKDREFPGKPAVHFTNKSVFYIII